MVKKFLHMNSMEHILRAHQLCMEGYQVCVVNLCVINNQYSFMALHQFFIIIPAVLRVQVLYDDRLSTVWSAPNYCYRCGNMASILEVGVNGERFFNVFDAAPENDRESSRPMASERVVSRARVLYLC